MQLEIQFPTNQLEIDFSERLNTTASIKEIADIILKIVHPDVVDIWHRDNCHCDECYKYWVWSYWWRME